jgi:hypothetical protein
MLSWAGGRYAGDIKWAMEECQIFQFGISKIPGSRIRINKSEAALRRMRKRGSWGGKAEMNRAFWRWVIGDFKFPGDAQGLFCSHTVGAGILDDFNSVGRGQA